MRDTYTIFRRELGAYRDTPMGAVFLIVFTLISGGLFAAEFFLFPTADLRGFFSLLPFLFCVFIPAAAMRLWAEDLACGTMEMLLTFPMRPAGLVAGKYLAGLCFVLLALAGTLLLPIMITVMGRPDLGQIAASYLGAMLLGGFFLALSQFVSAFFQDQITAFVLSFLTCFTLALLGSDVAATALDAWINGLGTMLRRMLGVTTHYAPFTRGVVSIASIVFFLGGSGIFLFLNTMFLKARGRRISLPLFALCSLLCLGFGLFAGMALHNAHPGRFDWTENRVHTISEASKRVLADLEEPVEITYYVTPAADMPTEIKTLERDVTDLLEDLRLAAKDKIVFKRVHMHAANVLAGPGEESGLPSNPLEQRLFERGVEPFSVSALRRTGAVSNLIYSSLGIKYMDRPEEIIPQIVPDSLHDLEYAVVSTAFRLSRPHKPMVTIVAENGFQLLERLLRQEGYQVRRVRLDSQSPLPAQPGVVLVMQPTRMNARQVRELEQALIRGGKMILAVQSGLWAYKLEQGQIHIEHIPLESGMEDMLQKLGISIESRVLMDEQNMAVSVARSPLDQVFGGGMNLQLPMQIVLTKDNMHPHDPVTARLENIFYLWGSALNLDEEKLAENGLTSLVLAVSSPRSWLAEISGNLTQSDITPPATGLAAYPVMAWIRGQFPSNPDPVPPWPDAPETVPEETSLQSRAPGQLLVLGGASLFDDDVLPGNSALIVNAVNTLSHGPDLALIRGKAPAVRLIAHLDPRQETLWKALICVLPGLTIAALFLLQNRLRARRRILYARSLEKIE
jgi:ABC-type transport system involved in multi-copper enzyme maturation permease subunit/ABC-type uncharacterized transport system involved in gliding motility auxiliary subunit